LIYYDSQDPSRRKERGKLSLKEIKLVEKISLKDRDESSGAFQIGYNQNNHDGSMCVVAKSDVERDEWITLIRNMVRSNANLADKYHPCQWSGSKWICCGETSRSANGCEPITWTPRQSKSDPVPPLPASVIVAAEAVAAAAARQAGVTNEISDDVINALTSAPGVITNPNVTGTGKVVVALYPFTAIETGDLTLAKGEEYQVLDDSQDHWWKVTNKLGEEGFIPSNYVKEKDALGLQNYDWYVADMSRQRAESLLKSEDKEGCFVVRNSSQKGLYTLSLFTKIPHSQVKRYHIKQNSQGFYLSEKHCCPTIPELIEYHSYNAGGLACRLKCPPGRSKPPTAGLSHGKWEIDPTELTLQEELGSGQFGVVRRGKWKGTIDVAVKMMKEGTMSEDDFIEEAKVMTKLQHTNLVQLYGVCSKNRPIFIITEYMKHGSLLQYLRRLKTTLLSDIGSLIDMAIQVARGMAYLERHNYIHRDLAARNCLVGSENVVKVADFGLARYVIDDQYTSNGGAKFPIKWSPPEVLNYTRFSSKSDVWAFGVLCWEVFTCGDMPYGRAKNPEVVDRVQKGQVLSRPQNCPHPIYEVMRLCWATNPDDRPPFRQLKEELMEIAQTLQMD